MKPIQINIRERP